MYLLLWSSLIVFLFTCISAVENREYEPFYPSKLQLQIPTSDYYTLFRILTASNPQLGDILQMNSHKGRIFLWVKI
jgi:hypothetical protein